MPEKPTVPGLCPACLALAPFHREGCATIAVRAMPKCVACGEPACRDDSGGAPLCEGHYQHCLNVAEDTWSVAAFMDGPRYIDESWERCESVDDEHGSRCELQAGHAGKHMAFLNERDERGVIPPLYWSAAPIAPAESRETPLMADNGFPRAHCVYLWTKAERAIQDAVDICERTLPADRLETDAITLLGKARETVARLVDREIRAGRMPMPAATHSGALTECVGFEARQ